MSKTPLSPTPKHIISSRRQFIASALALLHSGNLSAKEQLEVTPKKFSQRYNNYYEFSTEKEAVFVLAQELTTQPWNIELSGLFDVPLSLSINDLKELPQHSRTYRFRCVEGWSMVVPWSGIELRDLLTLAKPLPEARYIQFTSLQRPSEMIGQRRPVLNWPYVEALRLDEAMHPLSMIATGMYDETLPKQNGGPARLVVPWKYGFKSAKAIVKIEALAEAPTTTWMQAAPREYGFYANVNPNVAHPRWSQKREAPLGQSKKIRTLMFNGYEEVASLYQGMDLETHF